MKKCCIFVVLLALLLCLVLAGCGESPAEVEVQWFAPSRNLTYGKYVWDASRDDGYCPIVTVNGKPGTIDTIAITNEDTGEETVMGEEGSDDLVFRGDTTYTVTLRVDLGKGKTTDKDHVSCEPQNCEVTISSNVVAFAWTYYIENDQFAGEPEEETVAYDIYVDVPAPKIGETAAEETAKIALIDPPEGVSIAVNWHVYVTGQMWRDMSEDEVFSDSFDSSESRKYVAIITLTVPDDFDTENSTAVVYALRASSVSAPMVVPSQQKTLVIYVNYSAADLEALPESLNLVVDMGDIFLGDKVQETVDRISVTANGAPVAVTRVSGFMDTASGYGREFSPSDYETFEELVDGYAVHYYGFKLYLEGSEALTPENINTVYADGNCVVRNRTEVAAANPYTEENGIVVTIYLDTNLMKKDYEYKGTVDINLNIAAPYFGESVDQWMHALENYVYTSTKVYNFGDEMDIIVYAITGKGMDTLSNDYILTYDPDIHMYQLEIVLYDSGLTAGQETKVNLANENRVSSWESTDVRDDGCILVFLVYSMSDINESSLYYNAYDIPTGMTVEAVTANLPESGTLYLPDKTTAELEVTGTRFLDAENLPHNFLTAPNNPAMNSEDRFLADHEYCLEVTFAANSETVSGLNNKNVKSLFGSFVNGPIIGVYDGSEGQMSVYLFFRPVDMGTCEHVFTYDYVAGKEPTCTEEGEYKITCSLCGYSYTAAAPAIDHDMQVTEKKEPTCTVDGYTVYTCKNCGDSYTIISEALHHHITWTGDNDYHWHACKRCGYVPKDNNPKEEHVRSEEIVVEVCIDGLYYYRYHCGICGKDYYFQIIN